MANPIRRSASPATEAELVGLERSIGHPLPPAYRASLLAGNGGVPRRRSFRYPTAAGPLRRARVVALAPTSARGWGEAGCPPLPDLWEADGRELVDGTIAVGVAETDINTGTIRLGVAGASVGRVSFRPDDTARGQLHPVAEDWDRFLDGLGHAAKPAPWDELIEDGDEAAFFEWTRTHRRKWNDGVARIEIERKAVEEDQRGILAMLVDAHGFDPASIVGEALDAHRLGLARHFLPGADPAQLGAALDRPGPHLWHDVALVEALIAAGADPGHEGGTGLTPLHHAARAGSATAARVLLDHGADPTLADDEGRTPRDLAERAEHADVAALLRAAEAARPAAEDPRALRPFDLRGVEVARSGAPITLDEILAVEAELKLSFPPEYRWLLTQFNGAILRPGLLPPEAVPELYPSDDDDDGDEEVEDEADPDAAGGPEIRLDLYPLRQVDCPEDEPAVDDEAPSLSASAQEMAGWYHDGSEIPRGCLPIGSLDGYGCDGSGFLLLGCRGARRGKLFAFDHADVPLHLTLPDLFARLAAAGRRAKSPAERLADAVEAGDLDGVRAAVAAGAANAWMTRDGRMPLRAACEAGFDEAAWLIGAAAKDRAQAIEEALMAGRVALARRLVDATPRLRRDALEAILHYPAAYADPDFLAAVVARGVKLEKLLRAKDRTSPLEAAAMSGSVAGLQFLLDRGGSVAHVDHEDGTTLLHMAVRHPGSGVDPGPMIAFLLGRGVPLKAGDSRGDTALHFTIRGNHPAAARALIDAGASMADRAARHSPMMDDPRTKKLFARAEKEMQKLARELDRSMADLDPAAEDAPMLDADDPEARRVLDAVGLAGQLRGATGGLLANLAGQLDPATRDLGPAAADLHTTCPYPHVRPLIDELVAYEASRRPGG